MCFISHDINISTSFHYAHIIERDCFVPRNDDEARHDANESVIARFDFSSTEAISFRRLDCFVPCNNDGQKKDFIFLMALRF